MVVLISLEQSGHEKAGEISAIVVETLFIMAGLLSASVILPMKRYQDIFVAIEELDNHVVRGAIDTAIVGRNKFGAV